MVADAWFGSYKVAFLLRQRDLFVIMNVKTAHKRFPKDLLKSMVKERGDTHFVSVEVEGVKIWGGIHMDTQPLCLVFTTGTCHPGERAQRTWRGIVDGKRVTKHYELPQPDVHGKYRALFNRVDLFNKVALGPSSI